MQLKYDTRYGEYETEFLLSIISAIVIANGPGDLRSIPGRVIPKTQKMVLDASLALSIIRHRSRVKWVNPGKGVAPSPIPRCSSYRKGSLRVTLDYSRQLYLLMPAINLYRKNKN